MHWSPYGERLFLKLSCFTGEEEVTEIQLCICAPALLIQSVVFLLSSSTMDSHMTSSGHCAWEGTEVTAVWQTLGDIFFQAVTCL